MLPKCCALARSACWRHIWGCQSAPLPGAPFGAVLQIPQIRGETRAAPNINSVQNRCIVKGEAQKSPLFWRFSGGFEFSQDLLFSRNSTRQPSNLIKSPNFANTPCKSTCLYNAPSMHTFEHSSKTKSWKVEQSRGNSRKVVGHHFPPRKFPLGVGFSSKGLLRVLPAQSWQGAQKRSRRTLWDTFRVLKMGVLSLMRTMFGLTSSLTQTCLLVLAPVLSNFENPI